MVSDDLDYTRTISCQLFHALSN